MARFPVPIFDTDTAETIKDRVNKIEHLWQWRVLSDWLHGVIVQDEAGKIISSPYWNS